MGLMDVLNGMQNGPHGQRGPSASSSGGMSPITMAVLGFAGLQSVEKFHERPKAPARRRRDRRRSRNAGGNTAGLPGGLARRTRRSPQEWVRRRTRRRRCGQRSDRRSRRSAQAISTVRPGRSRKILGRQRAEPVGFVRRFGQGAGRRSDQHADGALWIVAPGFASRLSQHLPEVVNELTPDGRLPTEQELSRSI